MPSESEVQWRGVLGYEGFYEASNDGRVRRLPGVLSSGRKWRGRILKSRIHKSGYAQLTLSRGGSVKTKKVSSVVCEAFHGRRPDGKEAAHADGVQLNDVASNLSWKTHVENEQDKITHGTKAVGFRNGRYTKPHRTPRGSNANKSNLSDSAVLLIRSRLKKGISAYSLAKFYGISKAAVLAIKHRRTWTHI